MTIHEEFVRGQSDGLSDEELVDAISCALVGRNSAHVRADRHWSRTRRDATIGAEV